MQHDLYRVLNEYQKEMIDISQVSIVTCVVKHKAASAIGILSLSLADTPLS